MLNIAKPTVSLRFIIIFKDNLRKHIPLKYALPGWSKTHDVKANHQRQHNLLFGIKIAQLQLLAKVLKIAL